MNQPSAIDRHTPYDLLPEYLSPEEFRAYLGLGRSLEAQGDRPGALGALRAAVRYMPQQAEAHRELGALLARDGQTDEAAAELRQALRLAPEDAKAKALLDEISLK